MAESSVSTGSSSSKSLLWMMIAMFVGIGALLSGGLFMASRMVHSVGLSAATNKDTIRTPAGSFRLERQNEAGPTLPIYPNAILVLPDEKAAVIALQQRQMGMSAVTYETHDTRESVDIWYSKNLSPEFARHDAGENPASGSTEGSARFRERYLVPRRARAAGAHRFVIAGFHRNIHFPDSLR